MSATQFHWQSRDITPRLLMAVGHVTLSWSMIDHEITKMVQLFWHDEHRDKGIPRPFDRRARHLKEFADDLYANEAEEWITFRWYLQRLREANGRRDAIAHGQPGKITKGRRTYRGLMVPHPSRPTNFIPMTTTEIADLAQTISRLLNETLEVSYALYLAQAAASPDKHFSEVDGKWTQLTRENRSPMLPRWIPPPPTFQG